MLHLRMFTVGAFAENPYLLTCTETRQAIFIDPGAEDELLWQAVLDEQVELVAIVLTHAHIDHVGAVETIRRRAQVPVYLHPDDNQLLADVVSYGRMFGFRCEPVAPAEHALARGGTVRFGNVTLQVLHTPGHSPGSVCLYSAADQTLIAGDTLFSRSVGRTDLPGGDALTLLRSIRTYLWPLPDAVQVYPGHGPATTIGQEKQLNPFVGGAQLHDTR